MAGMNGIMGSLQGLPTPGWKIPRYLGVEPGWVHEMEGPQSTQQSSHFLHET